MLLILINSTIGIRLTQYIVDAPCSEMHTDGFLEVIRSYSVLFSFLEILCVANQRSRSKVGLDTICHKRREFERKGIWR